MVRKKYTSGITFIDSLNFLNSSLSNLAGNLETADFVNTKQFARDYILKMDGVIHEEINVGEFEASTAQNEDIDDYDSFLSDDEEVNDFDADEVEDSEESQNEQRILEADDDAYRNYAVPSDYELATDQEERSQEAFALFKLKA